MVLRSIDIDEFIKSQRFYFIILSLFETLRLGLDNGGEIAAVFVDEA